MQRWMLLSFFMTALTGCSSISGPEWESTVVSRPISGQVSDESYRAERFDLPEGGKNFVLSGSFRVTRGGDRDINAWVVDATEYANFRSGNNFYPLYSRRRVTTGRFDIPLERSEGPYYFILDNSFSAFTDKWIVAEVILKYERRI